MIRIVIISSIAVAATYIGMFMETRDTWAAVIAASSVSAIAVIVVLVRTVRLPMARRTRLLILGVGALAILGTATHMRLFYQQTHWQYDALHSIHKVIFHGVGQEFLGSRGIKVLSEYYDQRERKKRTLGDLFLKNTEFANRDSSIIEENSDARVRVFAASVSDDEVVLVAQATLRVDGEDPTFKNYDGQTGAVQDRLRITPKGVFYEPQN